MGKENQTSGIGLHAPRNIHNEDETPRALCPVAPDSIEWQTLLGDTLAYRPAQVHACPWRATPLARKATTGSSQLATYLHGRDEPLSLGPLLGGKRAEVLLEKNLQGRVAHQHVFSLLLVQVISILDLKLWVIQ
jgi:hypothetical protein